MYKHLKESLLEMERVGVDCMNKKDGFYISLFFVNQKRGNKKRLCVAYNDLNKVTQDDIYPLPIDGGCPEKKPKGKRYFSVIDLKSGYWQSSI